MLKGISMKFHIECNNFYDRYRMKFLESIVSAKIKIKDKIDMTICNSFNSIQSDKSEFKFRFRFSDVKELINNEQVGIFAAI